MSSSGRCSTRVTQNIPLNSDEREKLKILGKGFVSDGVRNAYEIICVLYACGLADLRGFFQPDEWRFLWHVMSLEIPESPTMYTQTAHLCALLSKPAHLGKTAKHYGVDALSIRDRIWESFHPMHTFALWWRVNEVMFGDGSIEDWSKF